MAESPPDLHPRVAAAIEADRGILNTFGMDVRYARDGRCEITSEVPAQLVNAAGFAHGSVAFSLLDTACAYALGSLEVRGVTVNANTTYVAGAAAGQSLTAVVTVVSRTRRTASLRGEVYLQEGEARTLAAHGSFVFQLIEVKT